MLFPPWGECLLYFTSCLQVVNKFVSNSVFRKFSNDFIRCYRRKGVIIIYGHSMSGIIHIRTSYREMDSTSISSCVETEICILNLYGLFTTLRFNNIE